MRARVQPGPSCARQEVYGSILTLMNDLSRCCPCLCPAPPLRRGGTACALVWDTLGDWGAEARVMTACVLVAVGVGSRVNATPNVSYSGNPRSHVSGTCGHYTSHWSGLWLTLQRAPGLTTVTRAVLTGKPMILLFSCFEIMTSI